MVVKWERRSLPNGAYRVSGIQMLDMVPEQHTYNICSYDEQFIDELTCVKESLGLPVGIWAGMMMVAGSVTEVLALLME